jgi:hypothetical protein
MEVLMEKKSLLTDVQTLRKHARQHINEGAVTAGSARSARGPARDLARERA